MFVRMAMVTIVPVYHMSHAVLVFVEPISLIEKTRRLRPISWMEIKENGRRTHAISAGHSTRHMATTGANDGRKGGYDCVFSFYKLGSKGK